MVKIEYLMQMNSKVNENNNRHLEETQLLKQQFEDIQSLLNNKLQMLQDE